MLSSTHVVERHPDKMVTSTRPPSRGRQCACCRRHKSPLGQNAQRGLPSFTLQHDGCGRHVTPCGPLQRTRAVFRLRAKNARNSAWDMVQLRLPACRQGVRFFVGTAPDAAAIYSSVRTYVLQYSSTYTCTYREYREYRHCRVLLGRTVPPMAYYWMK
jgi:hypothetical protein